MSRTAKLGAAAFMAKILQGKKNFSPLYMEVKCEKCGYTMWADDEKTIEDWIELMRYNALKCSICGGTMKLSKASLKLEGKDGGKKASSFLSNASARHPHSPMKVSHGNE